MFTLLTALSILIASMFVALIVSTLKETRNESVEPKTTAFRRTRR